MDELKTMTQDEAVLDYLKKHPTINCSQAFRALHVGALHSRIDSLRKKGVVIITETYRFRDQYGRNRVGWKYRLDPAYMTESAQYEQ